MWKGCMDEAMGAGAGKGEDILGLGGEVGFVGEDVGAEDEQQVLDRVLGPR